MSHKFVVVDKILAQLEAAKSGIVAGSISQNIVSGIQNVPSDIIQQSFNGGASTNAYTTFSLSPIRGNCALDKTYLNLEFDINYNFNATGLEANQFYRIPMYVGFRDTASIFNQLQILIENTAIWTTTYQRQESVLAYNSLPETEIRGNNQYASIEKMREGKYSPMKRIVIEAQADAQGNISTDVTIHFKCTVDLNRLTPLLSNLHYTTPHFGNLRLKVFLNEIEKALLFCPDYSYIAHTKVTVGNQFNQNELQRCFDDVSNQPIYNQYWQFYPFTAMVDSTHPVKNVPLYCVKLTGNPAVVVSGVKKATSFYVTRHSSEPFMSFRTGVAEIVQTNFEMYKEEYDKLSNYFASLGSVIIPSQTWSSLTFNNSTVSSGTTYPQTQIGSIGGYNIDFISVWSHIDSSHVIFTNEFLTNIQLILDGRPINSLPYTYVNDKCVVDVTQAIIDTDHEEINQDFIRSLTQFNITDTPQYIPKALPDMYGDGSLDKCIMRNYLANPNTYALNFSTNLPDAFHSGSCVVENVNRQATIRFNATSAADTVANLSDTSKFPLIYTHKNSTINTGYSAFCDCCIVLTYDAAREKCFEGQLSWAAPYQQ